MVFPPRREESVVPGAGPTSGCSCPGGTRRAPLCSLSPPVCFVPAGLPCDPTAPRVGLRGSAFSVPPPFVSAAAGRGGGWGGVGAGNAPAGLSLPRGYGEKSPRLAPRKSCLRRAEPGAIPLSGDARFEFHAKAFCGTLQRLLRKQPAERQLPRSTACRRCRRSRAVDPPPLLLRGRLSSAAAEAVQNAGTASACRWYLQVF